MSNDVKEKLNHPHPQMELPFEELPTLTISEVAILLTVLDKEAHNSQYYEQMHPDNNTDTNYIQTLKKIIFTMAEHILPEFRVKFLKNNQHLQFVFPDLKVEAQIKPLNPLDD